MSARCDQLDTAQPASGLPSHRAVSVFVFVLATLLISWADTAAILQEFEFESPGWPGRQQHFSFPIDAPRAIGSGDLDGDGQADVAIAWNAGHDATGRLQVRRGNDGSLLAERTWTGRPRRVIALAATPDANGDATPDLVVALSDGRNHQRLVEVLCGASLQLISTCRRPPDLRNGASTRDAKGQRVPFGDFGHCVAGIGDIDGDGCSDVVISAPYARPQGSRSNGVVVACSGATGRELRRWSEQWYLFGLTLSAASDLDGDGVADILVGAPPPRGGPVEGHEGALFALSGHTGRWIWRAVGGDLDELGWDPADIGDLDGDGTPDVLVRTDPLFLGLRRKHSQIRSGRTGDVLAIIEDSSAVGDLDGDGLRDLSIKTRVGRSAAQFRFVSTRTGETLGELDVTDKHATVVDAGDVNGDGRPELLVSFTRNQTTGVVQIVTPCAH